MPEGKDGWSDRRGRRGQALKRGRGRGTRPQESKGGREQRPQREAGAVGHVRQEQRREGEWQLKGQSDEEGRLEHDVGRHAARPDQALEVLLECEADRRHECEEAERRRRGPMAAEAVPDAEQQTGDHERQSPDEERGV